MTLTRLRWLACVPLAAALLAALAAFAPSPAAAAPVRWCAFNLELWHIKYGASIYVHNGCGGQFQVLASTNNGVYHGNTTGSHGRSDAYTYPYRVHSFGYRWRYPPGYWHNVWPAWASSSRAHLTAAVTAQRRYVLHYFNNGIQHLTEQVTDSQNATKIYGTDAIPGSLKFTARVRCKRLATGAIFWAVSANHSNNTTALAVCPSGSVGNSGHQTGIGWDGGTNWIRYNV
jgi:hypothetical protein